MHSVSTYQSKSIEFPKHDVDPKLKKQAAWNKEFLEAIYSIYLRDQAGIRYSARTEMDLLRLYAEGNQPVTKYQDRLCPKDAKTGKRKGWMNISWDILSVAPKVRAIVVGMMEKIDHDIICSAIDPNSEKEKDSLKWSMWAEKQLESVLGPQKDINALKEVMPVIPNSLKELEMFMQMGANKLKQEIAMESALDWSFYLSRWKTIKKKIYEDFFDLGVAATKDYVDHTTQRVMSRYVDPINLIVKYSRDHAFNDVSYAGEVRHVTIAQLRKEMAKEIASGEVTEETFAKIATNYCGYKGNPTGYEFDQYSQTNGNGGYTYDEFKVCILDAEYKSYDVRKYETKTTSTGEKFTYNKPYKYKKKNNPKRKPGKSEMPTIYKGSWVVGTEIVFDYGLQYDIPRQSKNEARMSYHIYKISNKSMLASIIPQLDNMQITWLKMQNALAMAAPGGLAIEFGSLSNISMGGKKLSPLDVLAIRRQTGDLLYKSTSPHPSPNPSPNAGKPVFDIQGGVGSQLTEFVGVLDHNANMIRSITGINEAVDSSMPNPEIAVGNTEVAIAAANNVLNYFYSGYEFLKEESAKNMALRWQIVSRYKEMTGHYPALGKNTMNVIRITKDLSYAEYGLKIEMRPTEAQRARVLQAANMSLQARKQGGIGISMSDYVFIENTIEGGGNLKYVQMYLAWREEQEYDKAEQSKQAAIEQQGQQIMAQQQASREADMEMVGAEAQGDIAVETAKSELRQGESDNKYKNDAILEGVKSNKEMQKNVQQGQIDQEKQLTQGLVQIGTQNQNNNQQKRQ